MTLFSPGCELMPGEVFNLSRRDDGAAPEGYRPASSIVSTMVLLLNCRPSGVAIRSVIGTASPEATSGTRTRTS
jgi:hypothetical protein